MDKKTSIFERISKLIELKGFKNIAELAKFLGYSSAERLYRLNREESNKPSFELLLDISNKFENINLNWLVTGEGEITQIKNQQPFERSNLNDSFDGYIFDKTNPVFQINKPSIITQDPQKKPNINIVSNKNAQKYVNQYHDKKFIGTLPILHAPHFKNENFRAFEVAGHSMSPTLYNGTLAIGAWIENKLDIMDQQVYTIVTAKEIYTKRILNRIVSENIVICISDHENKQLYPNILIKTEEIIEIWHLKASFQFDFRKPDSTQYRLNDIEGKLSILFDQYKLNKN